MNRRSQPRRYTSQSYVSPPATSRRRAARRRRRTQRLLGASLALVLLVGAGVTAWLLLVDRGPAAADATDTANGDGPQTVALESSPSPKATASEASSSPSPSPTPEPTGTFTGTYVPILMYHRIEKTSITGDDAAYFCAPGSSPSR